jgi:hypothetical protein
MMVMATWHLVLERARLDLVLVRWQKAFSGPAVQGLPVDANGIGV